MLAACTDDDLTGPAVTVCRAAIAAQVGRSLSDVAVFDVADARVVTDVQATVARAEAL